MLRTVGVEGPVTALAIHHDSARLCAASSTCVAFYDLDDLRGRTGDDQRAADVCPVVVPLEQPVARVTSAAWNAAGTQVALSSGSAVVVVEAATGRTVWQQVADAAPTAASGPAVAFGMHPDDDGVLAIAGRDRTVRVWCAGRGDPGRPLSQFSGPWPSEPEPRVAFDPVTRRVAVGGADGTVHFFASGMVPLAAVSLVDSEAHQERDGFCPNPYDGTVADEEGWSADMRRPSSPGVVALQFCQSSSAALPGSVLVALTSGRLAVICARSLAVLSVVPLRDAPRAPLSAACLWAGRSGDGQQVRILAGLSSLFDPAVCTVSALVDPAAAGGAAPAGVSAEGMQGVPLVTLRRAAEACAHASKPKWDLAPAAQPAAVPGHADKPVMFHKRIRSSGYGPAPASKPRARPGTKPAAAANVSVKPKPVRADLAASAAAAHASADCKRSEGGAGGADDQADTDYHVRRLHASQVSHGVRRVHETAVAGVRLSSGGGRPSSALTWGCQDAVPLISSVASLLAPRTESAGHKRAAAAQQQVVALAGHEGAITAAAASGSPGGRFGSSACGGARLIVSASVDKTARLWREDRPDPLVVIADHEGAGAWTSAGFFDLDRFVMLAGGSLVRLYAYGLHLDDGVARAHASGPLSSHGPRRHRAKCVFEHRDTSAASVGPVACPTDFESSLILYGASNRSVTVLDVEAGKPVRVLHETHSRAPHTLRLVGDHGFLTSAADGAVRLWDLRCANAANASSSSSSAASARASQPVQRLGGHLNRVHTLGAEASPCGRFVATGSEDQMCHLYDLRTGSCVERLAGHSGPVSDVAWHREQGLLVSASFDGTLRCWIP